MAAQRACRTTPSAFDCTCRLGPRRRDGLPVRLEHRQHLQDQGPVLCGPAPSPSHRLAAQRKPALLLSWHSKIDFAAALRIGSSLQNPTFPDNFDYTDAMGKSLATGIVFLVGWLAVG